VKEKQKALSVSETAFFSCAPTWLGRLSLYRIDLQLLTMNIITPVGRFTRSPLCVSKYTKKMGLSTGK
jgi:hypothetical protein